MISALLVTPTSPDPWVGLMMLHLEEGILLSFCHCWRQAILQAEWFLTPVEL